MGTIATCNLLQRSQAPATCHRRAAAVAARCVGDQQASSSGSASPALRRGVLTGVALAAVSSAVADSAQAIGFKKDLTNKRRVKVPEDQYTDGPDGVKYYDVVLGKGPEAEEGKRVVVHFEAKWKGVTFITTRQGLGVTGGTPLGFDVGAKPGAGGTLKGLDLGVRGMRVGGRRKLIVPPNLAYGDKGVGEIPPGATLDFDVELLSIKQDAAGYRVKLVEG